MFVFEYLYVLVAAAVIFFLVLPFVNVVLSFFRKEKLSSLENPKNYDFACIITAYKNVEIARELVRSLVNQDYENHLIYLVADACAVSGWNFEHEKFILLRPEKPLNLKVKSIIHAIDNFKREHEFVLVFDADNLAQPDFLKEINRYANAGFTAIQGQRTAKNLDTTFACADATGEFYKNFVERYVPYLIGSSSVISGSGMAVESGLYKAYLNSPEIQEGQQLGKKMLQEDKILQNFLLRQNKKIAFAWNALVYDEKVRTAEAAETQRSRWLYSYFQNLPNSFEILLKGIKGFCFNQLMFGLITLSPPLFILLFGGVFLAVTGLFFMPNLALILGIALVVFAGNIFLTLYLSKVPVQIWHALWGIPLFIWKQILALLKMRDPNKNFKHTEHNQNSSVEDILLKK